MPARIYPAASSEVATGRGCCAIFNTKVSGAWELARATSHRTCAAQGGGRFIVIIGQAGKVPQANAHSVRRSSTLRSMLSSNRCPDELAPSNILVNAVCPSRIKSPLDRCA